jgi:hypothetical protein
MIRNGELSLMVFLKSQNDGGKVEPKSWNPLLTGECLYLGDSHNGTFFLLH